MENHYQYKVEQSQFNGDNQETFIVSCNVVTTCESGEFKVICIYSS